MSALRLEAASASDPGRVRAVNEDKAIVADDLVAVADGMGGHAGGEVAATTAIEALRSSFVRNRSVKGLLAAVEQANRAVYDQSVNDRSLRGMGTTLTAAAVVHQRSGDKVVIVNVGDSRAYLLDGSGFARLTEDHSLVEEMVRRGELTPEEAAVHPHRHIVTRALGIDEDIEVDAWELEPQQGARLLLCSDGLTNELDDGELAEILGDRMPPEQTAQVLVERALAHGGSDNVTVVVVDLLEDGEGAGGSAAATATAEGGAGAPDDAAPDDSAPQAAPPVADGAAAPAGASADLTSRDASRAELDASGIAPHPRPAAAGGLGGGATPGGADPPTAAVSRTAAAARPSGEPATRAQPATPGRSAAPAPREERSGAADRARRSPPTTSVRALRGAGSATDTAAVPVTSAARAPVRAVSQAPRALVPPGSVGTQPPSVVRIRHERIMTLRVALFVVLLAGVLAGVAGFVGWFVRASYFVGVVHGRVAILEGRPGGFLWFKPTLVERTTLAETQVFAPTRSYLEAGMEQPSLAAARRVVTQLANGSAYLTLPTGSTRQADGVPTGSTLVPISSPVPTAATLPPPTVPLAPATTVAPAGGNSGKTGTVPGKRPTGPGRAAAPGRTGASPRGVAGVAALAGAAAATAATTPTAPPGAAPGRAGGT